MTTLTLTPGSATLAELERLWREGLAARLDPACHDGIRAAHGRIAAAAEGQDAVYGVNTGFGKLASVKIDPEDTATLQRNLILSHSCGVGEAIPGSHARLMMALKLLSLGRGASGVRMELIELLEAMLARGVTPVIPGQGSVGASGDLAPLAHMTAAMIGEGEAFYQGQRMSGADALERAGLQPVVLGPKEGLAMINGTQTSTALALAGLFDAWHLAKISLLTGAMSTDAAMGSNAPFHEMIQTLRGHQGQIDAAAQLRSLLSGSQIRDSHLENDERVQDPYCLR